MSRRPDFDASSRAAWQCVLTSLDYNHFFAPQVEVSVEVEIPVVRHCKFCGRTHLPLESFKATQKLCRYRSTRKHTETENCLLVTPLRVAMSMQTTIGRNGDRFDAHPLEARADVARVLSPAFASAGRASSDDHVFLLFRRHFSGDRTFFRVDGREARTHW